MQGCWAEVPGCVCECVSVGGGGGGVALLGIEFIHTAKGCVKRK